MDLRCDKVIGIVGGMGPEAGAALYNSILLQTDANSDQDHLSVILMSFPKYIVDRTAFLEGSTRCNPAFAIAEIIQKLEIAGAKVIAIACNTSYAPAILGVIEEILRRSKCNVKLLNMPYEVLSILRMQNPQISRIGLMTTNGTYKARIYEDLLKETGYDVVIPDPEFQNNVIHRLIYDRQIGLKANPGIITTEAHSLLRKSIDFFEAKNVEALILGCTELSCFESKLRSRQMKVFNSTEILAKAVVREALSRR